MMRVIHLGLLGGSGQAPGPSGHRRALFARRRLRSFPLDRLVKLVFHLSHCTRNIVTPTVEAPEGRTMRYQLTAIFTRPWLPNGLSLRLIESHYENHYGGALRRLNATTAQLEPMDFERTPAHVVKGLKREQLIALNSTLLHEL